MNKRQVLDLHFIDARSNLLELAGFIDRMARAGGEADFRWSSLRDCMAILGSSAPDKTKTILELLSDPTSEPVTAAGEKGAAGAWPEYPTRGV